MVEKMLRVIDERPASDRWTVGSTALLIVVCAVVLEKAKSVQCVG